MRIVAAVFCVLMLLFAAVQYNDPDALFWGAIYGVAAMWCGVAALVPDKVSGAVQMILLACLAVSAFGVVWFWPRTPGFWRQEVWWETETAREGMGMMIAFVAIGIAWLVIRKKNSAA